ncbi:MAG: ECF transporter S component [Candidatus Hodarchaeota archaeon]
MAELKEKEIVEVKDSTAHCTYCGNEIEDITQVYCESCGQELAKYVSSDIEREAKMSRSSSAILQITGAALFGALSIVLSAFLAPIIPRVPGWGIAYFDPVSIVWVMCFFIFGTKAGLLCCGIGTLGLMPFDPFAPIGPLMKLFATLSLIIIPIILLRLYKVEEGRKNSQKIKNPLNFVITGILGIFLRIVVMLFFNVLLFLTLFSDYFAYVNLDFLRTTSYLLGTSDVTGWSAVIIVVVLINTETSLWDLLIPYALTFGLRLDEKFDIW